MSKYFWPSERKVDPDLMKLIELVLMNSKFTDMPIRHIESEISNRFPKANLYNFMKSWNQLKREKRVIETRSIHTAHELVRLYALNSDPDQS